MCPLRRRQRRTPRVSVSIRRTPLAQQSLGRSQLRPFTRRKDGRPETGAQLQILSPGHQRDRRYLRQNGSVSRWLLL